jgi:acetyltransferase-like isoleucine patch superfamily enzyme
VFGRLDVRGPGEVIFGDNVAVVACARPYTHAPEARIVIGNNVIIGETRFGCVQEIVVGDNCRLAMAYIMDSDLHSPDARDRGDPSAALSASPVRLGENVWVAHFAGILPGTIIGRNSIVSFGSVCRSREYPANVVLVGNPARVSAPVRGASIADPPSAPVPT